MTRLKKYTARTVMFVSSYFPLYIMLIVLHYEKYDTVEELLRFKQTLFLVVLVGCIIISIVSIIFLKISRGGADLSLDEIERSDDTIISYMMTYIIPILTTNFISCGEVLVNIILFLLIGYLYIRMNLLYLNPLWSMFGYLSYRANSDIVIITNISFANLKHMKKNCIRMKGFYIANDIFVAQKDQNDV